MRVTVAGAGEIGTYIAERISQDDHDVTVIDSDEERADQISEGLDVQVVCGSAASAKVLQEAGIGETDLFVAVTGSDDTNLVCASVARKLGAKRTVARVDEVVYRKAEEISYSAHFQVDELVSPEMLTALELASLVRNPGVLAVEHFARGTLEVQQLRADRGAKNVGTALVELELPEGVRVGSIHREEDIIIPTGTDQVEHNDLITLIGKTEQVVQARVDFETDKPKIKKVVVMGGGHTALSLARRLKRYAFKLTIIERDEARCQYLATNLGWATILHGDGTKLAFLKEERIDNADFFISVTGRDEDNILSALQAKNLGVEKVMVMIHRPDYTDLTQKMGIDQAVSPRAVMAREMLGLLRKGLASTLARLDNGRAEILEISVQGNDFVGQRLRELQLPAGCLIVTLLRDNETLIPTADTVFQLDDTVLAIVLKEQRKAIIQLITGEG